MKKIINTQEIKNFKTRLYYKIFDMLKLNNDTFYLDKEFNLIWNNEKEVVGIINNKNYYFFDDINLIINSMLTENIEL